MGIVFVKPINCNKRKILIFSADDRKDDFINFHNKNIKQYCDNHDYAYIFHGKNYEGIPIYWSKLLYCRDHLYSKNNYEFVMWMDTDANIINNDIKISELLCKYDLDNKYHIFIGTDIGTTIHNAGLFIIRNSDIGREFIDQCIHELKTECKNDKGYDLGKQWAGICYEQGRMNKLINNEYFEYTVHIPSHIFKNTYFCDKDTFILHKYGPKTDIMNCFNSSAQHF